MYYSTGTNFALYDFFPGPAPLSVNNQIFSYIFKLGFRNIQEKSGKLFSKYKHNSLDLQLHITRVESKEYIVSSNTLTNFKQLK